MIVIPIVSLKYLRLIYFPFKKNSAPVKTREYLTKYLHCVKLVYRKQDLYCILQNFIFVSVQILSGV